MIVDLGCGDGRGALALAVAEPGALVLGLDASAPAMAETSRRAAKSTPNLVFLAASADVFACELPGVADLVSIAFPWGTLLRGVMGVDPVVSGAVGSIVRPGGRVSALVSVTPRDGIEVLPSLDDRAIAALAPPPGLELVEACPATREEILASRSTWGRRLLAGGSAARPVWRLEWRRPRGQRD